jgi:hypothetical protein
MLLEHRHRATRCGEATSGRQATRSATDDRYIKHVGTIIRTNGERSVSPIRPWGRDVPIGRAP